MRRFAILTVLIFVISLISVSLVMAQAKPGGRYVILPTAAPINIPLRAKTEENYIAWVEAALKYGKY